MQHPSGRGCTLTDYAAAKGLDIGFLESLGTSEIRFQGAPAVRFPYLDEGGVELCVRFRVSLDGDLRVRTKAGMKHCLYGLNRLPQAAEAGYVLLVEGESDAQTLWQAGYRLGSAFPGANGWNEPRDAEMLDGIGTIYVFIEPDRGGEAVFHWLGGSAIRDRVRLVLLDGAKDVSELWLSDRERFADRLEAALQTATPWAEHARIATGIRAGAAWERCKDLAREPRLLDVFGADLASTGLSGERRAGQLLYLVLTSAAARPPRLGRRQGAVSRRQELPPQHGLSFFPPSASYSAHRDERTRARLRHGAARAPLPRALRGGRSRAASPSYLIRSLLSEGRVMVRDGREDSRGSHRG